MKSVTILDTTLRDGEQSPGVVFTEKQKIDLAKNILDFGVDRIELMPAVSKKEESVARHLIDQGFGDNIFASTMARKDHIKLAKDLGLSSIVLFTSVSDIHLNNKMHIERTENTSRSIDYVKYAKDIGLNVYFAGEDSTRADSIYLLNFINELGNEGVEMFLACDTLGILTPDRTYDFIKKLKEETNTKIGMHCHNDFGQATANTLAGIAAGADVFSGTFTGIGERAGNAPTEEVVSALRFQYGLELPVKYDQVKGICDKVKEYSGIALQKHKPICGENAFAHESGIHVDGVLKYQGNYEPFEPELLGIERKFLYGKHSGKSGLRFLFGDRFSESELSEILDDIKIRSESEKRSFNEVEILDFYRDYGR